MKYFGTSFYHFVAVVQFKPFSTSLIAAFGTYNIASTCSPIAFATLNPTDGNILQTYSFSQSGVCMNPQLAPQSLSYESTGDLYVAGGFNGKWALIKLMITPTISVVNPVIPAFYKTISRPSNGVIVSRASALVIDNIDQMIFVSGKYPDGSTGLRTTSITMLDMAANVKWHQGYK